MDVSLTYTIVWALSAVVASAFGGWVGCNPLLIGAASAIGSPVAGLGLIAILKLFGE